MTKVYLSGPMRGIAEYNYPAFEHAASALRWLGYDVLSPHEFHEGRTDLALETYLRSDIEALLKVDQVWVLPGYRLSAGCYVELTVARALGLEIRAFPDGCDVDVEEGEFKCEQDYLDLGKDSEAVPEETILEEAQRLVYGERGSDYGHPWDDFSKTAALWSILFGVTVTPEQVGLAQVCVKISRQMNRSKRDNLVDIAGYAATVAMIADRRASMPDSSGG